MASMSQLSISVDEFVDESIKSVNKSIITADINDNMIDFAYFYGLDDFNDCETNILSDLQKFIEK